MSSKHFDWKTVYITPKPATAITETVILTLTGVCLGHWLTPDIPLSATSNGLSWLIIGPLLSGLRYGLAYALGSMAILMSVLILAQYQGLPWASGSYATIGLGLLLMSMAVGEFRNAWNRRARLLYQTTDYLDKRLNEVTAAFNIMKLSHDRMEQELASDTSLRSRLLLLRRHLTDVDAPNAYLDTLAPLIMKDFIQFGDIKEAKLYQVNNGTIKPKALASIGFETSADALASPINLNNTLIQEALNKRQTISLNNEFLNQAGYDSSILLVIALVDVNHTLWGLLAIKKMAFRAFNTNNIRDLAVIGQEMGNILTMQSKMGEVDDPDLQQFVIQLKQCIFNVKTHQLPSTLVSLELTSKLGAHRAQSIVERYKRHLDQIWIVRNESGNPVIFILMPFIVKSDARGYLRRLEKSIKQQVKVKGLKGSGVVPHTYALKATDSVPRLMKKFTATTGIVVDYKWS